MNNFIHLHTHTVYTLGNSSLEVEDLVRTAAEFGMDATAIVDSGTIDGFDKFTELCKRYGVSPIYGCGFYLAKNSRFEPGGRSHLVLLAFSDEGLANLVELNHLAFTEGFHESKAHIDDELLEKFSAGLVCLTGGNGGDIDKYIIAGDLNAAKERALYYRSIFGSNFYLELQDHGLEKSRVAMDGLIEIHEVCDIPLIATQGAFYLTQDDAVKCNDLRKQNGNKVLAGDQCYFKSAQEMEELFAEYPDALENVCLVTNQCRPRITF